jgi:hypothetical protein
VDGAVLLEQWHHVRHGGDDDEPFPSPLNQDLVQALNTKEWPPH